MAFKPAEELAQYRSQLHRDRIGSSTISMLAARRFKLRQLAPLKRIAGCWLSRLVSLKDSRYPYGALLLKIHATLNGSGIIENSQQFKFEQQAIAASIRLAPTYSKLFCNDSDIDDLAFRLPSFLLAIAHFPATLLPEILGVNLYMSLTNEDHHDDDTLLYARQAVDQYLIYSKKSNCAITKIKIERGFLLAKRLTVDFYHWINQTVENQSRFSVEERMRTLIAKIGPQAYGYHKQGEMGGKPIDEWFHPDSFNAEDVLNALSRSKYIQPGKPDKSRFLHLITSPRGPMFRIFSPDDVELIKQWITQLNTSSKDQPQTTKPKRDNKPKTDCESIFSPQKNASTTNKNKKYSRCTLREAYYYLINIEQHTEIKAHAKKMVRRWLKQHRLKSLWSKNKIPFSVYQHEKLDQWLHQQHQRQVDAYQPLQGAPEASKQDVIDDAVQLAPLILIDGAWVRGSTHPAVATTAIGSRLYHIFIDELGNGDTSIHHGNIYRKLLQQMNINLPEFDSYEFCQSPLLKDQAFKVPVFWLAISLFQKTFLPEILGLNLAMELSGIGGDYRTAADTLKYYGFSPQFNQLHNTIDNIVTGHTAWSIEAIKLHLDEIEQQGGIRQMQQHWQRVWNGYQALSAPKGLCSQWLSSVLVALENKTN